MRAKVIYLLALLVAYLLTSCRTSKKVERMEASSISYEQRTANVVSLDSLQRWLHGRILVTEVHLHQPDSTGAQAVAKVVKKELTFAAGEELAQEVKSESVEESKTAIDVVENKEKYTKRNHWLVIAYFGLLVSVIILIFVQFKQLKIR